MLGKSPKVQTSRKEIIYKESKWNFHTFSICSGEPIAQVEVLKMAGSLLLWISAPGQNILTELALGMPAIYKEGGICERRAASTTIFGPLNSTESMGLASRLASALRKPVYVSCNIVMDRFTAPLVEKGLMLEVKNNAECF